MSNREKVKELLLAEPMLTARQVADKLGLSRQRVHQLVSKLGLKTADGRLYPATDRRERKPPIYAPRLNVGGSVSFASATAAGTAAELIVAADLTTRGWYVFFPLVRAKCDLVAMTRFGDVVRRFEVRCAKRLGPNSLSVYKKPDDVYDHYAIVIAGEPVLYEPALTLPEGVNNEPTRYGIRPR